MYDPTAGTGGVLSVAKAYVTGTPGQPGLNPDARLRLYGEESNDQSYAICESDMIVKGQDATNIRLGDTLSDDLFAGTTFDYCLSNPLWRGLKGIAAEREGRGAGGVRAQPVSGGLPPIGDGQMLFLQHLATRIRPVHEGGGRAAAVLDGSPLFTGGAES